MEKLTPNSTDTRRGRPTITDVARHCGLSKATVSKVVNLPPEQCPIAEATRERVLAAVAELNYRPSWQGRALANRRTNMIAVVNADPHGALPRGLYWNIVDELDTLFSDAGLVPTYIHTFGSNPQAVDLLRDRRFDACLSLDSQPPEVLEVLREEALPAVFVNADVDASWTRIRVDDEAGTRAAMEHLIGLGHTRIAYNAGRRPNSHPSAIIRATTYTRCMREAGLVPEKPFLGPVDQFVEQVVNGSYQPTAILDYEHWTTLHILQHLWRHGKRVPDDYSVVTFNDTYPTPIVIPPLTTVDVLSKKIPALAVEMLGQLIDKPTLPPRSLLLGQSLVVRESTAAPRVR
ncbi:MAG: LacI family DNA-binding transcriptional regulator [Tepidisphaeraceae bacterium]